MVLNHHLEKISLVFILDFLRNLRPYFFGIFYIFLELNIHELTFHGILVGRMFQGLDKFKIVHIHANNFHSKLTNGLPKMLEVTFLNSKLIKENIGHVKDFPIDDLDYPCDPRREDISFSFK